MHKLGDTVATGSSIPDSEHQITQHAEVYNDNPDALDHSMADPVGPRGDWHVDANYHNHQAGTQWEALPAENLETHYVPKDQIVAASFGKNDVTDVVKTAYANGQRAFKAENAIFVDPKPDVRKGLTIRWIHNGETGSGVATKGSDKTITVPDGLPASVVANDDANINAGAGATATP